MMLSYPVIDIVVFLSAVAINILMVLLFRARIGKKERTEHLLGLVVVAFVFPLIGALLANTLAGRAWYWIVLPGLMIVFLVMEWILDYVLKVEFRKTKLVWPYSIIYYLGLLGLLGYTFAMGRWFGMVTLVTYFANLAAVWIAHSR